MKTYTTETGENFTISYANSLPAGYGHRKIIVSAINDDGDKKTFYRTTNNMYDYDKAMNLEGQEQDEALFEIVENDLQPEITDWIEQTKNN